MCLYYTPFSTDLFDIDDNIYLENVDLECEPQNEFTNKKEIKVYYTFSTDRTCMSIL